MRARRPQAATPSNTACPFRRCAILPPSPKIRALGRLLAGDATDPAALAHAEAAAAAELDLPALGGARVAVTERLVALLVVPPPAMSDLLRPHWESLARMKCHLPSQVLGAMLHEMLRSVTLIAKSYIRDTFVRPLAGVVSRALTRIDRYERRTFSRRKAASRALDQRMHARPNAVSPPV